MNNSIMPKISIIVPIYNSEKYLYECLKSIQNQTFKDFECILINDGSTDDSEVICTQFLNDNRFRLISKKNEGVSIARNVGIETAIGDYIQFVDSDDYLNENISQKMFDAISEYNSDCVICGVTSFINHPTSCIDVWTENEALCEKQDFSKLLRKWTVNPYIGGPYNKLFKRSIIIDHKLLYEEGTSFGEDFVFNIKYFSYVQKIYILHDCLYCYRRDVVTSLTRMKHQLSDYYKRSMVIDNYVSIFLSSLDNDCKETCMGEFYADLMFRIIKKYPISDLKKAKTELINKRITGYHFVHKYLIPFSFLYNKYLFFIAIIYVKFLSFVYKLKLKLKINLH